MLKPRISGIKQAKNAQFPIWKNWQCSKAQNRPLKLRENKEILILRCGRLRKPDHGLALLKNAQTPMVDERRGARYGLGELWKTDNPPGGIPL